MWRGPALMAVASSGGPILQKHQSLVIGLARSLVLQPRSLHVLFFFQFVPSSSLFADSAKSDLF